MREFGSFLTAPVVPGGQSVMSRIGALLVATAAMTGLQTNVSAVLADEPGCDLRRIDLRFVGSDSGAPLAEIQVEITSGYGEEQQKFGPFQTDETGSIQISLPRGFYSLHLRADKDLPYLPVEALWKDRRREWPPDLSLHVTDVGVEKWLAGEHRKAGHESPATPGDAPRITYTLLPACELVLRAVDSDTGQGLPGATFYEENAIGEEWAHSIDGENLGWEAISDDQPGAAEVNQTRHDGTFRRLVGANAGYKYGVELPPPGYEPVEGAEVEIDIPYGKVRAEYVFKFRPAEEK